MFKIFSLTLLLALFSQTFCITLIKNTFGQHELSQVENLDAGSANQLVRDLSQTVDNLQKFDGAVANHKDAQSMKSLAQAFESAKELGQSLKQSHES